jgi:hypothetical protein
LESRNNKNIEKLHFAYFKECCNDLPLGIVDDYGENPDFLIKHDSGVLGIEHTQLFKITKHPNAPQALESFRKQIIETAKKCCEKNIPPLLVRVWFYFNQKVPKNRKQEIKRISEALVGFVNKWHQENPSKFFEYFSYPSELPAITQIGIVHSWNGKTGLPYHHWIMEGPAVVGNFSTEKVQSCINEKNDRYEEYLKRCDECWLLIVIDIFKDSQSFEMPARIDHRFESKFERVFYLDASHRKDLRELHINRIKSSSLEGNDYL